MKTQAVALLCALAVASCVVADDAADRGVHPISCGSLLYTSDGDYFYDSSILSTKANKAYTTTGGIYDYTVNVCGPVNCADSEKAGAAACQTWTTDHTHYRNMGQASTSTLTLSPYGDTSGYTVTYEDGHACSDGTNRSTIVQVICVPGLSTPHLEFDGESSHCVYEFTLKASEGACPLSTDTSSSSDLPQPAGCTEQLWLPDGSAYYDIYAMTNALGDPLSATSAPSQDGGGTIYDYDLNICGRVECNGMHLDDDTPVSGCQRWVDGGGTAHARATGTLASTNISLTDTGYTVAFTNGDSCSGGDVRTTLIDVVCDHTKDTPQLTYTGELSHCLFGFTLAASEACPIHTSSSSYYEPEGCVAHYSPPGVSEYFYDVSALFETETAGYTTTGPNGASYDVNICGGVECGQHADNTVGACLTTSRDLEVSLGSIDGAEIGPSLSAVDEGYTITYYQGDVCPSGGHRTTLISVVCDESNTTPVLSFIEETNACTYEFKLSTEVGCPVYYSSQSSSSSSSSSSDEGEPCTDLLWTDAGTAYYDVSSAGKSEDDAWSVTDGKYTYTVNVCGGVECGSSSHSAGCQSWSDNSGTHTHSLGMSTKGTLSPTKESEGYTLTYTNGDTCSNGDERRAIVNVVCSHTAPNLGFLGETSHCTYEFTLKHHSGCLVYPGSSHPWTTGVSPGTESMSTSPSSSSSSSTSSSSTSSSSGSGQCVDKLYTSAGDGGYFDVAAVTLPAGKGYHAHADKYAYAVNPCGVVACPGNHLGPDAQVSGCQNWTDTNPIDQHHRAIGVLSDTQLTATVLGTDTGFTVSMGSGDACSNGDVRTTLVEVVCDASLSEPYLVFEDETAHCLFEFTLYTPDGCVKYDSDSSTSTSTSTSTGPSTMKGCADTFDLGSGNAVMLSDMDKTTFIAKDSTTDTTYTAAVCQNVACLAGQDSSGCKTATVPGVGTVVTSLGSKDTAVFTTDTAAGATFQVTYEGGSACGTSASASLILQVTCTKDGKTSAELVSDDGCLVVLAATTECTYVAIEHGSSGHGSSTDTRKRTTGGDIALMVILGLLICGIGGFALYKYLQSRDGPSSPYNMSASFDRPDCSRLFSCCNRDSFRFEPLSGTA